MPPRTQSEKPPPYDREAEQAVLGAVLLDESMYDVVRKLVSGRDFHIKSHRAIWRAMELSARDHALVDATTVQRVLRENDAIEDLPGGGAYLIELRSVVPAASAASKYAEIVRNLGKRRRVMAYARNLATSAAEGNGYRKVLEDAFRAIIAEERTGELPEGLLDLWELCEQDGDDYDWLVKDLLEREGRIILYGEEGGGKSLFTLQCAVQAACGMPILGRYHVPRPLSVLYVDTEMSRRQIRRRGRALLKRVDVERPDGRASVPFLSRPAGIDITQMEGRRVMESAVAVTRPDLLVVDAFYKLSEDELVFEKQIKPVLQALDDIRTEFHCGIWLVHHPRKAQERGQKRAESASDMSGSAILNRWPELLIAMHDRSLVIQKSRDEFFNKGDEIPLRRGMLEVRKGGTWTFDTYDGAVMTELHDEILEYLDSSGPASGETIRKGVAKNNAVVSKAIKELLDADAIHTVPPPSGKGHSWYGFGAAR